MDISDYKLFPELDFGLATDDQLLTTTFDQSLKSTFFGWSVEAEESNHPHLDNIESIFQPVDILANRLHDYEVTILETNRTDPSLLCGDTYTADASSQRQTIDSEIFLLQPDDVNKTSEAGIFSLEYDKQSSNLQATRDLISTNVVTAVLNTCKVTQEDCTASLQGNISKKDMRRINNKIAQRERRNKLKQKITQLESELPKKEVLKIKYNCKKTLTESEKLNKVENYLITSQFSNSQLVERYGYKSLSEFIVKNNTEEIERQDLHLFKSLKRKAKNCLFAYQSRKIKSIYINSLKSTINNKSVN